MNAETLNGIVKNARVQGLALTLAELHRLHGCDVEIKDILDGFGLSVGDLAAAGAPAEDLDEIAAALGVKPRVTSTAEDAR
jgi:hypothetical protein